MIQEGLCNSRRISKTHFSQKSPSGVPILEVNGVKSIGFRITTATPKQLFGNKVVPLLSVNDPLTVKLIRHGHVMRVLSSNTNLSPHYGITDTLAKMNNGPYASMICGIKKKLHKYVRGCVPCNKEAKRHFNPVF